MHFSERILFVKRLVSVTPILVIDDHSDGHSSLCNSVEQNLRPSTSSVLSCGPCLVITCCEVVKMSLLSLMSLFLFRCPYLPFQYVPSKRRNTTSFFAFRPELCNKLHIDHRIGSLMLQNLSPPRIATHP
jgi:hypothetical protein